MGPSGETNNFLVDNKRSESMSSYSFDGGGGGQDANRDGEHFNSFEETGRNEYETRSLFIESLSATRDVSSMAVDGRVTEEQTMNHSHGSPMRSKMTTPPKPILMSVEKARRSVLKTPEMPKFNSPGIKRELNYK